MESEPANFVEVLTDAVCQHASNRILRQFGDRARENFEVSVGVENEAFWQVMKSTSSRVGAEPVLLVSRQEEGRIIRHHLVYAKRDDRAIKIERRPHAELGGGHGSYIATIEGIDVFGADFSGGTAWLFSAQSLQSVTYDVIDGDDGRHVQVTFEGGQEGSGVLRVRYKQSITWADTPILEIRLPTTEVESEL